MTDTLVSAIISDAFRESNLIAVGASATSAQTTEALRLLNRVIGSVFGNEAGDKLYDIEYGVNGVGTANLVYDYTTDIDSSYVPKNTRVVANLSQAKTIYLDPMPESGSRTAVVDASGNLGTYNLTVNGNGRTVETAASVVLSTNSTSREWFYRGDLGDWKKLSVLLSSDTSPFPPEFDDMLIIGLALRLSPRFGRPLAQESILAFKEIQGKFRSRYRQTVFVGSEQGLIRMRNLRRVFWNGSSIFATGRP